jgi:tight adherence protein B
MRLEPTGIVLAGVAGTVFVLFLVGRFLVESLHRWLWPTRPASLTDRLEERLAAVQLPTTLCDRLDRSFERLVSRSSLNMTTTQAAATLLLAAASMGSIVVLWRGADWLALAAMLATVLLVLLGFWWLHQSWQRKVQDQLPDTFHLLSRSLRAGLTVDQSVALIGSQGTQPLATEFKRCSEHLKLGMTVPAALSMTGARIDLPDFDLLVALVTVHRDTGGNLPLLVDRLASTVRSRNHFRGHVGAVTALGRLTGSCLAAAPPVLMLIHWLLDPAYLTRLTRTGQGLTALGTAVVLEVVGVVWMVWLLRIDY